MIAIKELLVKFGQVLEVIAWEAIHWDIVKFYYVGFALEIL